MSGIILSNFYFMSSKNKNKSHYNNDDYQENRFNDGKHYNKKHKTEKKSRNNVKQDLRKMCDF